MTQQSRGLREWIIGLALILTACLLVTPALAQKAQDTGALDVSLQMPYDAFQYEDYEVTAVVKDTQGRPVNGIPVVFSVESDWRSDAGVFPRRVMTKDGVARTFFQSNMPGIVTVTAQAGGAFDSDDIVVSGTGSTVYYDEQRQGR